MGRIYKRGGRLYGDYQTPEGKRVQRSLRTSDKAVAKERLRVAELAATPQARGRRQRLSEAIDHVIKTTMHDRAPATRRFYEEKARRIITTLGDPWVADITKDMLAGYIGRRLDKDDEDHGQAKAHTVQKELIVIRRALREAHESGVLPTMPPLPRFSAKYKPREVWLEPAEFEKLAANLGRSREKENKYSAARRARRRAKHGPKVMQATPEERVIWVSIAALAGASASEVESLDWADVKFDTHWLKLRGEKRETRQRWVPMAPALEAKLLAAHELAGRPKKGRVVKRWHSVRHGLRNACTRAGLDKFVSPNDLRRTFASWLVQQGVPLLTVATLMGHSSTRMVEKVYGKLSKANLEAAIAVLPQLLAPPPESDQPLIAAGTEVYTAPEQAEQPELEHLRERVAALEQRRDELLVTIRNLSASTPYPDEAGNAAVLIAEVGTLRARVAELELLVDAHEDASTPAFDDIARMCGVPHWEYPGQVVRDVAMVINHARTLVLAVRRARQVTEDLAAFARQGATSAALLADFEQARNLTWAAADAFDSLKTDPRITPEPDPGVTDVVTKPIAPGTTPDHQGDDETQAE